MLLTLIKGAVTVAPAVEAIMRQRRAREAADELRDLVAERAALQRAWEAFHERLVAEGDPTQAFLTQASLGGLYYETLAVIFHAVVFWGFFAAFVFALVDAA